MRVLFADAFEQSGLDALARYGFELDYRPQLTAPELVEAVGDVDVLVVRSTRVESEVFANPGPLGLVIRAGAGTNTIASEAAARQAVFVANVPGKNSIAVAELTMGLIMAIDRRIADNARDARAGVWNKKEYSQAGGLFGKTLGLIGLGQIGLAVAARARAFGLNVIVVEKDRDPATVEAMHHLDIETVADLGELARSSDIVSVHVPAASSTKRLIDAGFLGQMRPGAILINTSRGDVIDEQALLAAIEDRNLRVGIDVFEGEPSTSKGEFESGLARHPSVLTTHHIGASTAQAQEAIAAEVVEMIRAYQRGEIRNVVNLVTPSTAGSIMFVRHYDRVGVLSAVFAVLRRADLNVQEMQNRIFAGAGAALAIIQIEGHVPADVVATVGANPDVIHVAVRASSS